MTVTLRSVRLLVDDQDAALAVYCGALGLAVRADVVRDGARVVTLVTNNQTDVDIVLALPRPRPTVPAVRAIATGVPGDELRALEFSVLDLTATFDRVSARPGVEVWQEPVTRAAPEMPLCSTLRGTSSASRRHRTLNARTFRATVVPAGNATGVEVPVEVVDALGDGKRPKVAITINGHSWRSRIASKGGRYLVGISAANRAAAGIAEGDEIEVMLNSTPNPARWTSHPT